jgi:hypothetical protein
MSDTFTIPPSAVVALEGYRKEDNLPFAIAYPRPHTLRGWWRCGTPARRTKDVPTLAEAAAVLRGWGATRVEANARWELPATEAQAPYRYFVTGQGSKLRLATDGRVQLLSWQQPWKWSEVSSGWTLDQILRDPYFTESPTPPAEAPEAREGAAK